MASPPLQLIPVGIDLGSRRVRIAVCAAANAEPETSSSWTARMVSNAQGQRSTLALAVPEVHVSTDNQNGNSSTPQAPSSSRKDSATIIGDAARVLLEKQKKPLVHVRDRIVESSMKQDGNDDHDDDDEEILIASASSFLGHCGRLAADASACQVSQLRVVVSVPVEHVATATTTSSRSGDNADKPYPALLQIITEQGLRSQLETKKRKQKHLVVGTVADPAAICLAHGVLDSSSTASSTTAAAGDSRGSRYSNILVIDGGASGLTVSHVAAIKSSALYQLRSFERLAAVSGPHLVTLLAKHVASQFERQHRLPSNIVWEESKKAQSKLLRTCETVIGTLCNTTSSSRSIVHVTIDSLHEGLDCHISVSPPRWDMLMRPLLSQAQSLVEKWLSLDTVLWDAVLTAGNLAGLLTPLVDKALLSNKKNDRSIFRGRSTVAPDEAVALGCARHAASCISHNVLHSRHASSVHVVTSPVAIGIGALHEQDAEDDMETLIGVGAPLPAHVVHSRPCQDLTLAVWQLHPSRKILAELQGIPTHDALEVLVELTSKGKLSVAVQGGTAVII